MYLDRDIVCLDCGKTFVFSAREQAYYETKGYREPPRRCLPCRKERRHKPVERGKPA
jgi:hypothetical protein